MKSIIVKIRYDDSLQELHENILPSINSCYERKVVHSVTKVYPYKPRKAGVCKCNRIELEKHYIAWGYKFCPYCGKRIGGAK